jgi:hypothetical protein
LAIEYEEPGRLPAPEPDGPWGRGEQNESEGKPFLPDEPPVDPGGGQGGPWGPRRG